MHAINRLTIKKRIAFFCSLPFWASLSFTQEISVGVYPWVPRVDQFQMALTDIWAQRYPDDTLIFVSNNVWDGGYGTNPSDQLDVYVFDAMHMNYFARRGWLLALEQWEVEGFHDYFDYAVDGVQVPGTNTYWGLPQLGCTNILFYRADDSALCKAKTLTDVEQAMNSCQYTGQIPPDDIGLMADISGSTTSSSIYLDATFRLNDIIPLPQPSSSDTLNEQALENIRSIIEMASFDNVTKDTASYERARWFNEGHGRAFVGFSEAMSVMDRGTLENIAFKVMPLNDIGHVSPLFYADVIGIYPKENRTDTELKKIKELANVMASTEYMVAATQPLANATETPASNPQYLMPTRQSAFIELGQQFPIYRKLKRLVIHSSPVLFVLDEHSKDWVEEMGSTIKEAIRSDIDCPTNGLIVQ